MSKNSQNISQQQIQDAADYIRNKITSDSKTKIPKIAIVCGSGFSKLGELINNPLAIPYSEIPHFPTTTVEGHSNQMLIGIISKTPVILFQGRFHFYEGYSFQQITIYVKVLKELEIEFIVLSNAAGGINPGYKTGDVMFFTDHLTSGFLNIPILPENIKEGFTFKKKKPIYNQKIIKRCQDLLKEINYEGNVHTGVYAYTSGPNYETVAEIKYFKTFGADAVGMSTVPEVLIARESGIQVVAFSLITNECIQCYEDANEPNHQEITEVCSKKIESLKKYTEKLVDFLRCCCVCPGS